MINNRFVHMRYANLTSAQAEIQAYLEIDSAKAGYEYIEKSKAKAQKELDEIHVNGGRVAVTNHGIKVIFDKDGE